MDKNPHFNDCVTPFTSSVDACEHQDWSGGKSPAGRRVVVLKFGGTTVGATADEGKIRLARKTICQLLEQGKMVVPVFSAYRRGRSQASSKISVTDILTNFRETIFAAPSVEQGAELWTDRLRRIHIQLAKDLGVDSPRLIAAMERELVQLRATAVVICSAQESVSSLNDQIVTAGERLAVITMAAYLNRCHATNKFPMPVQAATAAELGIVTDNSFGEAEIDWEPAAANARIAVYHDYFAKGLMPIVTGFDGVYREPTSEKNDDTQNDDGRSADQRTERPKRTTLRTSLGRGGSDLTATFLGWALHAEYVGFCKETPGVLTADDRLVGERACTVPALDYELAMEAGNIYDRAIAPARLGSVPIRIFDPRSPREDTFITNAKLPHGIWMIDRPRATVNVHVGAIADRPGELLKLLEVFGKQSIKVEEVRHQRCGTNVIVAGTMEPIRRALNVLCHLGHEVHSESTWFLRALGVISPEDSIRFNEFVYQWSPLTASSYQVGARVLTATIGRNSFSESQNELRRIEKIVRQMHDHLIDRSQLKMLAKKRAEPERAVTSLSDTWPVSSSTVGTPG